MNENSQKKNSRRYSEKNLESKGTIQIEEGVRSLKAMAAKIDIEKINVPSFPIFLPEPENMTIRGSVTFALSPSDA